MLGHWSSGPGAMDRCAIPQEGCPCATPGESRSCGKIKERYDDYVACSMGTQTCIGTAWGPCVGDAVAYKSVKPLGASIHTLALADAGTCVDMNICSPDCFSFEKDNSFNHDAGPDGPLVPTDAGGFVLAGEIQPCTGLQCKVSTSCAPGSETKITGVVRDPAGLNPVYNALVFIPNDPVAPLPTIPDGAAADSCGGAGTLPVSVASAFTGADGSFTLRNVPNGVSMRIVIQAGKWRRDFMYTVPTACTTTSFEATPAQKDLMRFPRTERRGATGEGHIPKMAIVSASCEPMDCMMRRIGVADTEFGNYSQAGGANIPTAGAVPYTERRIHLFRANGQKAAFGTNVVDTPPRRELLGVPPTAGATSPPRVMGYDMVFLPCDCGNEYNGTPASERQSVADYADRGGRVMASHWGREWIEHAPAASQIPTTATWRVSGSLDFFGYPFTGASNPEGAAFRQWLLVAGAIVPPAQSFPTSRGTGRQDVTYVNTATSRLWLYGSFSNVVAPAAPPAPPTAGAPGIAADYTFDTPVGASAKFGRVMFTSMHLSDPSCGPSRTTFPAACNTSPTLAPQEKAMEFLLNNLGACVTSLPPAGVLYNNEALFRREFSASCPLHLRPVWHLFQWQSITPDDSSIVFVGSTAETAADLDLASQLTLATARGPSAGTWVGLDVESKLAAAGQTSQSFLRVDMTLKPSTNKFFTPTLIAWRVSYDCESAE